MLITMRLAYPDRVHRSMLAPDPRHDVSMGLHDSPGYALATLPGIRCKALAMACCCMLLDNLLANIASVNVIML